MQNKRKWIFTIAGSLILGALGSGLWSEVFAPLLSGLGHGLMSLLTLGMTSARDSIYQQAARGLYERPSVMLLSFIGIAFIYVPLAIISLRRIILPIHKWASDSSSTPDKQQDRQDRIVRLRRLNFWLAIVASFVGAVLFVQILFIGYTNAVVSHFNQTLAIASPYITVDQRTIFIARFASMQSRNDFILLFGDLNKITEAHGQPPSKFSPW
jgi:hypothetical protein